MRPRLLWTISAVLGGVVVVASSAALTIPGLWRGLPFGLFVTVMAANALAMSYGLHRNPDPAPHKKGRR